MSKQYTYEEIASNYQLWAEYVDPHATMTEKEFNRLSVAKKVKIQEDIWGPEEDEEDED